MCVSECACPPIHFAYNRKGVVNACNIMIIVFGFIHVTLNQTTNNNNAIDAFSFCCNHPKEKNNRIQSAQMEL